MKTKLALALSLFASSLAVLLAASPIFAAVSRLNTEFNSESSTPGITTSHGTGSDAGTDSGQDLVIQDDGKIVVVGLVRNEADTNDDLAIWRYNEDGTLDTSFSGDGIIEWDNIAGGSGSDWAQGVALQDDGKIVVVGASDNGVDDDAFIARYNTGGTLDTTFSSGDGTPGYDLQDEIGDDWGADVEVQADGKIVMIGPVAAGMGIWRYTSDGELDTSFSDDGEDFSVPGLAMGSTIQEDGKIVVCGMTSVATMEASIARYNTDGTLDTSTFNSPDGYTFYVNDLGDDYCRDVAVDEFGRIYVTGEFEWFAGATATGVARLNTNGQIDTEYGTDGLAVYSAGLNDSGYAVALEGSKAMIAAASQGLSDDLDFALVRFDENGELDTSFNGSGIYLQDSGNGNDEAGGVVLKGDGNIYATGMYMNASNEDMALISFYSAYQISNLGSSVYAVDDNGNFIEDGFSYGIVGDGTVTLQSASGDYVVAKVDASFADDLDWDGVNGNARASEYKSVVSGLDSAESAAATHTLYVPKASSHDMVVVCPDAQTLDEVSTTCNGREIYQEGDSDVSTGTVSGQEYWIIEGLSSSGGVSGVYEELSETGLSDGWLLLPGALVVLGGVALFARCRREFFEV